MIIAHHAYFLYFGKNSKALFKSKPDIVITPDRTLDVEYLWMYTYEQKQL